MHNFYNHHIPYNEYITGNSFINICEQINQTFCKTDYINMFYNKETDIFVTHNSDFHITEDTMKYAPKYRHWFAQNKQIVSDNIHSIPIGLENTHLVKSNKSYDGMFSTQVNGALYKSQLINKFSSLDMQKDQLIYLNFNVNTFPSERQHVLKCFKDKEWVTHTQNLPIEQFYFDVAKHKFIFSPRGNGIDCHRTWEALYLKTIPIVKRSIHMTEFVDLPILFVDEWEEITPEILNSFYYQAKQKLFNLDKLKVSYWKKRMFNS